MFAPAFVSLLFLYLNGWIGVGEYEPDVVEYIVEVGEYDCDLNEVDCDVSFNVYGCESNDMCCDVLLGMWVLCDVFENGCKGGVLGSRCNNDGESNDCCFNSAAFMVVIDDDVVVVVALTFIKNLVFLVGPTVSGDVVENVVVLQFVFFLVLLIWEWCLVSVGCCLGGVFNSCWDDPWLTLNILSRYA